MAVTAYHQLQPQVSAKAAACRIEPGSPARRVQQQASTGVSNESDQDSIRRHRPGRRHDACARHGADRTAVRPRRQPRVAVRRLCQRVCQAGQRAPGRRLRGAGLWLESAGWRQLHVAETQARPAHLHAALLRDVLGGRGVRPVRDALPDQGPGAHEAGRRGGAGARPLSAGGRGGLQGTGRVGERLPPDHQQRAPHQHPRGPGWPQAAHAQGQVAREHVRGVWRQPVADGPLGGVHRAADRHHGRAGEPAGADLLAEVPGGAGLPVADRPRLHAGLRGGLQEPLGRPARGGA